MANTTTTQIPAEVNNFYDRNLLLRVIPRFIHNRWAQMRNIPRNSGTALIKFRRYTNLSAATTALTEGITPTGSQLSQTVLTSTALQYGDFVTITDQLDFTSQDPVLLEASDILGDQAGDTLDILTRDILVAGTSVAYGGDATSRVTLAAGDNMTDTLIKKAVRTLKVNKARHLTRMLDATTGVGTVPIRPCFVGLVHPRVTYTVKGLTGFVDVEAYSSTENLMDGEIGKLDEVRFVESTNAKVFAGAGASAEDIYATLIFGSDAYGATKITSQDLTNIVKPFGSGDDPLNQRATSGWKVTHIATILNNDFITRLETTVAA